uniref:FIP-RBD domain-containing protein n=1 Tax=Elaeophora elaphi TaxID=1147741 RepID=A0A0R3RY26_9BILA
MIIQVGRNSVSGVHFAVYGVAFFFDYGIAFTIVISGQEKQDQESFMANFNNLVVTVVSARGLTLKSHNKLEAFVNLIISGKGNWKSKVQTDIIRTTADCRWDQRCEFTLNDMDSTLTAIVNHRTVLGTTDCIGAVELPLHSLVHVRMPTWYRLCKKGKYDSNGQQTKYRGEICLKFEFTNKVCTTTTKNLSASSLSINALHGNKLKIKPNLVQNCIIDFYRYYWYPMYMLIYPLLSTIISNTGNFSVSSGSSKLDTLKRKIRFGKNKNSHVPDTASLISLPQYGRRRSSLCEVCPTIPKSDHTSTMDLNRDGLITPPAAATDITTHYATLPYSSQNTVAPLGIDGVLFGSQHTSISSNRNSLNSSPIPIAGEIDGSESPAIVPRPRSATSSGFGSSRSTVINGSDLASIPHCRSREELLRNINDLRNELARKDAKINDLQDYIGKLLARIMEKSPEVLEVKASRDIAIASDWLTGKMGKKIAPF